MALPAHLPSILRFGAFELDPASGELRKAGIAIKIHPQPFRVLLLLAERPGQIVTREEIQQCLWGENTFVDFERGINFCVNQIRGALGDDAEKPQYVETLPRRGYRFIASVRNQLSVEPTSPPIPVAIPSLARQDSGEPEPAVPHFPELRVVPRQLRTTQRAKWVLAGCLSLAGLAVGFFWFARRIPPAPREPSATQITANSPENPVTSSAISLDGKYLAFTDTAGKIRVRILGTGETQTIPEPEAFKSVSVDWTIAGWFPDSMRFLANSRPPNGSPEVPSSHESSIWTVSVLGKVPQKLRDDARAFSVSPDGSLIAFGTNPGEIGDREIWLMDPKGQQARKLYDSAGDTAIAGLNWSRDGQRAIYFRFGLSNDTGELVSRDLKGGPATTLVSFSDWEDLTDFLWLPDGGLIYARTGDGTGNRSCNFWELRIDVRSGKPVEKPRQLTNWTGFCVGGMSVTADGKRLAFQRWAKQTTVNVADIEDKGAHLSSGKRLTLNEYVNAAETWTPDSKALVFRSIREGHLRLFKQSVDSDAEEPLVMGVEDIAASSISPDSSWLFYLDCKTTRQGCGGPTPLMRIPIQGGTPQWVLTSSTYGRPRCAVSPAKLCAIAEQSEDGKPLIFTAFDALKGRGAEVARFETEPGAGYVWALSQDGTRIAILKSGDSKIHILSLNGQTPQEVTVKGGGRLISVYWTADGEGWFTARKSRDSTVLLRVGAHGEANPLWELKGDAVAYGLPSPDGRHLAIVGTVRIDNVWLLENF